MRENIITRLNDIDWILRIGFFWVCVILFVYIVFRIFRAFLKAFSLEEDKNRISSGKDSLFDPIFLKLASFTKRRFRYKETKNGLNNTSKTGQTIFSSIISSILLIIIYFGLEIKRYGSLENLISFLQERINYFTQHWEIPIYLVIFCIFWFIGLNFFKKHFHKKQLIETLESAPIAVDNQQNKKNDLIPLTEEDKEIIDLIRQKSKNLSKPLHLSKTSIPGKEKSDFYS